MVIMKPRPIFKQVAYKRIRKWKSLAKKEDAWLWETGKTPRIWYLLRVDNHDVGTISLFIPRNSMINIRIKGWFVLPQYRRKGYGTMLLRFAMSEAENMGFKRITMGTKFFMIAEQVGFKNTGRKYTSYRGQKTFSGYGFKYQFIIK